MANNHASTNNGSTSAPKQPRGTLIAIGGRESKQGNCAILREVANRAGSGKLVVATLASEKPQDAWDEYRRVFSELGIRNIEQLDVREREELVENPRLELLDDATVIFFTGGDQKKITTRFGGTHLC